MIKTAATLRNEARNAEKALDWNLAASLWAEAISVYPANNGALAKADIANMQARINSCRLMAA